MRRVHTFSVMRKIRDTYSSMNRGAAAARGKWLVLFNNDTEVSRGWLEAMLDCANCSRGGGCRHPEVYITRRPAQRGWRHHLERWHRCQLRSWRLTPISSVRIPARDRLRIGRGADGAALRCGEEDRGLSTSDYVPMYYEDADLCFQARQSVAASVV